MSMEIRTILELIQIFTAYSVCVLLFPYIVFHHYLQQKTLAEKFILCTVIGNFYIINVVYLIFLLHIPGKLTLYLFSSIPAVIAWMRINQPDIRGFFTMLYVGISRLFLGEAKIRTIAGLLLHRPVKSARSIIRSVFSHIIHHVPEWIMLLRLLAFDVWYYAYQTVTKYSYGASDIIVHHYWINQMDQGIIFWNGIYPFGFHNIIYFLHTFFGLPMLSIMRVFGVTETLFIYLMLYVLLRKICRSRYTPFLGVFIFSLPNLFNVVTTMRYQWTLPQEYAMLFLYPCAYFLIQFFERKKQEIETENEWKKKGKLYAWLEQYHILPSTRSLIFFAMSFSLTLAVHFYLTIVAFFLCLAIAIAYFPIVLRPRYFFSIALAGLLSLTSAVAPMGIAYMQGTPLEGSLRWALGVMDSGSQTASDEEEASPYDTQEQPDTSAKDAGSDETLPSMSASSESEITNKNNSSPGIPQRITAKGKAVLDSIKAVCQKIYQKFYAFNETASIYLCNVCNGLTVTIPILISMEGLIVFTVVMLLLRRKFYYRNLLAISIYLLFLILLACAGSFHLPSLMDLARTSIFLAYAVPLLGACAADALYVVICRPFRYHRFTEILPIGLTCALTFLTISYDYVKPLSIVFSIQASGEVRCNYEIMENYPEKTWTIVTTTNSLQIINNKGWHMELCTFLNGMENYTADSRITIPSKYVFFYIEKTPLAYGSSDLVTNPLANTGYISEEGASRTASYRGSNVYNSDNRYVLESKMFYWAKEFQQKYPQEFQVFYEDDSFICYRIIQNEYNLYNFAIDYGFNS